MRTPTDRFRAIGTNGIQLCGIMSLDAGTMPRLGDAELIPFRDLAALCRFVPYVKLDARPTEVSAYRTVVEGAFANRVVVPAPFGTIFRNRDALLRWIELHYFTLADAVRFLEDRVMARVRVSPALATRDWDTREVHVRGHDFEETAFDSFRVLKKCAVAFVPLVEPQADPDITDRAEASFLVEREQWDEFTNVVKEEQRRLPDLRIEQSGPWPPYDFVKMEIGE